MAFTLFKSASLLALLASYVGLIDAAAHAQLQRRALTVPSTLPYNFTSLGCYTDNVNGKRSLGGPGYTNTTGMTDESCISYCNSKGFIYAGTEYSQECYCANSIYSAASTAPSTDCNMACKGNSSEPCGGPNRLNVFWNGQPAPAPPVVNPGPAPWVSLGCYAEGNGGRALANGEPVPGGASNMTVAQCTTVCKANNFVYAGVEYAGECYCANAFTFGGAPAPDGSAGCSMVCNGNMSEYCGGPNRLNVYTLNPPTSSSSVASSTSSAASSSKSSSAPASSSVSSVVSSMSSSAASSASSSASSAASSTSSSAPSSTSSSATGIPSPWKYAGCYTEGNNARAIGGYQAPDSNNLTPASCINNCISQGYTVAGMEYSTQCFCGNYVGMGGAKTAETDCSMPCSGDSTQKCGAGSRLSVWSNGTLSVLPPPSTQKNVGSWSYVGCLSDPTNGPSRVFPWQIILANNNSAQNCLGLCAQYGYMAAGMEYGRECYCGDASNIPVVGAQIMPDSDCSITCTGNATQFCGGLSRLSYYNWTGKPLYTWNQPTGNAKGAYQFLIGGVVVPLITNAGINGKVTFIEKAGTGPPNSTGAYELDLSQIDNFSAAWRTMHVKTDVFCSAGLTLPDKAGRQINVGGWSGVSTFGIRLYIPDGSPGVPGTNDWQENPNELQLQTGRWYPSAMIMANGSILVVGGEIGSNSAPSPTLEILPKVGGLVFASYLNRTDPNNLYPYLTVLPSGGILIIYYNEAIILDETTLQPVRQLPNLPGAVNTYTAGRTYPLEGTSVLMPQYAPYTDPLTVLVCGGSTPGPGDALDNCVSTQPEVPGANWTIERMPSIRVMSCMAALPDGTYLILNGAHHGVAGFGLGSDPNLNAVLYDPTKPVGARMSIMANTTVARMYHSEAILLQDGRVLVSGSDPETPGLPEEYRVEVFVPPYLLSGLPRPTFTITNKDWSYGQQVTINLGGALANPRVSLMGAVASTHGNSMGQRTFFPAFSCAGTTCTITAPPNSHVCPPGWFQVFVLDGPTPSLSQWVRIGGDPAKLGNWPNFPDFTLPGV